jgi:hypothetical protein
MAGISFALSSAPKLHEMLDHTAIKWFKYTRAANGTRWAHLYFPKNDFLLEFSKSEFPNLLKVKEGEIILLVQNTDRVLNPHPIKGPYLTHLVTPLDDMITQIDPENPTVYSRRVAVVASSRVTPAPVELPRLRETHRANVYPIHLLNDGMTEEAIQRAIWDLFQDHLNQQFDLHTQLVTGYPLYDSGALFDNLLQPEREQLRRHIVRENRSDLWNSMVQHSFKKFSGVNCEVCGRDLNKEWPSRGMLCFEIHDKAPIAGKPTAIVTVNDLSLVCANCHRQLHLFRGSFLTISELREIIKPQSALS